jgi:hypothetical protein
LTNVDFDGLPLSEVVRRLQDWFRGSFDVLSLPSDDSKNWGDEQISLKLSNVKASDVINAMNLTFENNGAPVRWQLKVSGNHAFLILKLLHRSSEDPAEGMPKIRRIFFVGDLMGDARNPGMIMDKLNQTIADLWATSFGSAPTDNISFHKEAQLLVFTGTPEQADFIQQALAALKQRSTWVQLQSNPVGTNVPSVNALKTK